MVLVYRKKVSKKLVKLVIQEKCFKLNCFNVQKKKVSNKLVKLVIQENLPNLVGVKQEK